MKQVGVALNRVLDKIELLDRENISKGQLPHRFTKHQEGYEKALDDLYNFTLKIRKEME